MDLICLLYTSGVPQFEISRDVLTGGVKAVDLFVDNAAVFASKGEMRKLVQGGGCLLYTSVLMVKLFAIMECIKWRRKKENGKLL